MVDFWQRIKNPDRLPVYSDEVRQKFLDAIVDFSCGKFDMADAQDESEAINSLVEKIKVNVDEAIRVIIPILVKWDWRLYSSNREVFKRMFLPTLYRLFVEINQRPAVIAICRAIGHELELCGKDERMIQSSSSFLQSQVDLMETMAGDPPPDSLAVLKEKLTATVEYLSSMEIEGIRGADEVRRLYERYAQYALATSEGDIGFCLRDAPFIRRNYEVRPLAAHHQVLNKLTVRGWNIPAPNAGKSIRSYLFYQFAARGMTSNVKEMAVRGIDIASGLIETDLLELLRRDVVERFNSIAAYEGYLPLHITINPKDKLSYGIVDASAPQNISYHFIVKSEWHRGIKPHSIKFTLSDSASGADVTGAISKDIPLDLRQPVVQSEDEFVSCYSSVENESASTHILQVACLWPDLQKKLDIGYPNGLRYFINVPPAKQQSSVEPRYITTAYSTRSLPYLIETDAYERIVQWWKGQLQKSAGCAFVHGLPRSGKTVLLRQFVDRVKRDEKGIAVFVDLQLLVPGSIDEAYIRVLTDLSVRIIADYGNHFEELKQIPEADDKSAYVKDLLQILGEKSGEHQPVLVFDEVTAWTRYGTSDDSTMEDDKKDRVLRFLDDLLMTLPEATRNNWAIVLCSNDNPPAEVNLVESKLALYSFERYIGLDINMAGLRKEEQIKLIQKNDYSIPENEPLQIDDFAGGLIDQWSGGNPLLLQLLAYYLECWIQRGWIAYYVTYGDIWRLIQAPESEMSVDQWASATDFRAEVARVERIIWNGLDSYLHEDIQNLLAPGDWIINMATLERALGSGLLAVNGCGRPYLRIGALQDNGLRGRP